MNKGSVYLVGAGPGHPKLITIRGLEVLRRSDAVVYDRLAGPQLLREAKPGAELIYVGKGPDRHTMKQEEINRLLVDLALAGKTVTRLKGGDPCVFGRVGEEAEALARAGIPFEIVPGITSAISVPAYAGIPVTHRGLASSFSVITGHESPDKLDSSIAWDKLALATDTLIFLMGVAKIGHIAGQLMRHGRPPETPVALVRWGTRAEQRLLAGTLGDIEAKVKEAGFEPPAVTVVGEVADLHRTLSWYERKPLFGRRILVTRAREQASGLVDRIEDLGGEAVELPLIRTEEPADERVREARDAALRDAASYDWLVFTSANGVAFFFERLRRLRMDIRGLAGVRLAAVGPKTREALEERGLMVDLIPPSSKGEALAQALAGEVAAGRRVLLARGNLADGKLPERLRANGVFVTEAVVYDTVPDGTGAAEVAEALAEGRIDAATFASSSTVVNGLEALRAAGASDPAALLNAAAVVCIGPVTAEAARSAGLRVARVAEEATIEALVAAIEDLPRREDS